MYYLFIALTIVEVVLFFLIWAFFNRLRKSERILTELQASQKSLLDKLALNAGLEQELMLSFAQRQAELTRLELSLEKRVAELNTLVEQAEKVSRSPQFLRELILSGHRQGRSAMQLAKGTGLSVEEVELILAQNAEA